MTSAAASTRCETSALVPVCTIYSSCIAIASTQGFSGSPVQIFALVMTISAPGTFWLPVSPHETSAARANKVTILNIFIGFLLIPS